MTARRVAYAIAGASMVTSGIYVFVYLYRWEWHRALVAGLIFVATEVGLATAAVLRRLGSLERRLDQRMVAPDPAVVERLRETAPPPTDTFAWLKSDGTQMNVFVPILLGAGMIASALAWVVERVARATATPGLERRLAVQLAPLALPGGGLVGPASFPTPAIPAPSRGTIVRRSLVGVLLTALTAGGIYLLAELVQDRPDVGVQGEETVLVLEVSHRAVSVNGRETAEAYWVVCRRALPHQSTASITDLGRGRAEMVVQPAIGPHALKRFHGCLEDAEIDRLQANVASTRTR